MRHLEVLKACLTSFCMHQLLFLISFSTHLSVSGMSCPKGEQRDGKV